jgi:hypothetical protein
MEIQINKERRLNKPKLQTNNQLHMAIGKNKNIKEPLAD